MFEIIDIKHKDDFIKIDFDTGESFRLTRDIFYLYSLQKGKLVDRVEYQQLKDESDRYTCKQKAFNYLSIRSRSSLELQNYLFKKGFPKDIIREIIEKLREAGYINDYDFAVSYIHHRRNRKAVGEHLLRSELYKKGISRELIKKAIKETGAEVVDLDNLYELALQKLKRLDNKKNKKTKIIYFLKQRGFGERDVRTVIDRLKGDGYEL